jgi:TonB-linked SusC/RagA family outer membrane protein
MGFGIAKILLFRIIFISAFFSFINTENVLAGNSDNKSVKGVVKDGSTNEPLVGVNVVIEGTTEGTITDINGEFQLNLRGDSATLIFSYIGYLKEKVFVRRGQFVEVNLIASIETLNEVLVIGYGTQKEKNITGSVSYMKSKDIEEMAVTGIDQTLQGRMAGVVITQNSASPGGAVSVRVRGQTSGTNNEPLYVIDGLPIYNNNALSANMSPSGGGQAQSIMATLNPSDIENISVLKDASATSIYGARGANGVVLITTKRGKEGQTRVTFETYQGVQAISNKYDLLNAPQFAELSKDAALNDGLKPYSGNDPVWPDIPPFINPDLVQNELGEGTDWQDEILRNGHMENYQLSILSGNEKSQYSLMSGYYNQDGIIKNSNFKRYSIRANTNTQVNDWFKFGSSLSITRTESKIIPTDGVEGSSVVITPALAYLPVISPKNDQGLYNVGAPAYFARLSNPLISINLNDNNTQTNRVLGNLFAEISLFKTIDYKINFGFDYNANEGNLYVPKYTQSGINSDESFRWKAHNLENMWLLENTLNWNEIISEHHEIDFLMGYSAQAFRVETDFISVKGFPNQNNTTLSNALEVRDNSGGGWQEYSLISMFGRMNYGYKEKYLLSFTLRGDGSSRFGENNRYGVFPAFSVGWRIIEEEFLSNFDFLNDLKVRYSYGRSGNQEIGNYRSTANMYNPEVAYAFGDAKLLGTWPLSIPNESLSWEETTQQNVGLDVGLFSSRVEITFDVYNKRTEGVLVSARPPVLAGYADEYWANNGIIQNGGFEALVSGRIISKTNFYWISDFNFSLNRNEVISYPEAEGEGVPYEMDSNGRIGLTILKNGAPLGNFYGLKTDGVFKTQAELDKHSKNGVPIQPQAQLGDIRFVDDNGDGSIDAADRVVIGNAFPDAVFGLTNRFSYRSLELSIFLFSQIGNDVYNHTRAVLEGMTGDRNQTANVLNRYQSPANPGDGKTPRATRYDNNYNRRPYTDRWVEDGSYLRLRNITLTYKLKSKLLQKVGVSNASIYVTGQNLYTWTNYSGFDPEISSNGDNAYFPGYDLGGYPQAKSVLAGMSITF